MTERASKEKAIAKAVKKGASLSVLKEFCISEHGLVSNVRRIEVWPILLDIDKAPTGLLPIPNIHSEQIEKDCERSLHQFDIMAQVSSDAKIAKQMQLSRIINSVFANDSSLHYYQGFNDIASIFLLLAGETTGQLLAVRSADRYLKYPL